MSSLKVESTPNPNSLKLSHEDRKFAEEMYSFSSSDEAKDHPLGRALIGLDGIDNVFIVPDFITVTKKPDVSWEEVLPAVKQIIRDRES